MDTSGADSGADAAGIPKNSETSKGGAPELSPINMKANKIVDFPIFVRLVMMAARIKVTESERFEGAELIKGKTQLRSEKI